MSAMHFPLVLSHPAQYQYRNEVPQHHHRDLPSSRAVWHSSVLSDQHSWGCGKFGTKRPQVQILSPRLYSRRSEALTRVGEGLSCCQYSSKIRQVQQRRRDLTCASKGLPQSALLFADRDRRKRSLEPTPQPRVPEHPWPDYRSDVVDGVERSGRGLKQAREHTADAVGQPAKDPNEYQQSDDDQVAEEHVEQQLPVGPLRAIRRPAKVGHRGRVQQMVERLPGLLHLVADDLSVHLTPRFRRSMAVGPAS